MYLHCRDFRLGTDGDLRESCTIFSPQMEMNYESVGETEARGSILVCCQELCLWLCKAYKSIQALHPANVSF